MNLRSLLLLSMLVEAIASLCPCLGGKEDGQAEVSEDAWDFGTVKWDTQAEHTFLLGNIGQESLDIAAIRATPPLHVKPVRSRINPGEWCELVTVLERKPRPGGNYDGGVEISFRNRGLSKIVLHVTGKIIPAIDVLPRRILAVSAFRGETNRSALTIINNEEDPLQLEHIKVDNESPRFLVNLETLEPGRKYKLTLTLKGEGKSGRMQDKIFITTSSKEKPLLTIGAFTLVQERVHTFPDAVDFGRFGVRALRESPGLSEQVAQTLMIFQNNGTDFRIEAVADMPFLKIFAEPSQIFCDRWQLTVSLDPVLVTPGKIEGNIGLITNDPEFPLLNVPVTGEVIEK